MHAPDKETADKQPGKMSGHRTENKRMGRDVVVVRKGIQYPAFKRESQQPGEKQGKDDNGQSAVIDYS